MSRLIPHVLTFGVLIVLATLLLRPAAAAVDAVESLGQQQQLTFPDAAKAAAHGGESATAADKNANSDDEDIPPRLTFAEAVKAAGARGRVAALVLSAFFALTVVIVVLAYLGLLHVRRLRDAAALARVRTALGVSGLGMYELSDDNPVISASASSASTLPCEQRAKSYGGVQHPHSDTHSGTVPLLLQRNSNNSTVYSAV